MARLLVLSLATSTAADIAASPIRHRDLARQLIRSSSSVALNLAEGDGRRGRDRIHFFRMAYASAQEAKTTIEILAKSGAVELETARQWYRQLHRIGGMIWKLMEHG